MKAVGAGSKPRGNRFCGPIVGRQERDLACEILGDRWQFGLAIALRGLDDRLDAGGQPEALPEHPWI